MMDCYLGGSGPLFRAIPKKLLGGSASSYGSVNPLFGFEEGARPSTVCVSGEAIGGLGGPLNKGTGISNGWSRSFFRFLFAPEPAWWLLYSAFARNWSFRPASVPLPWSKAS